MVLTTVIGSRQPGRIRPWSPASVSSRSPRSHLPSCSPVQSASEPGGQGTQRVDVVVMNETEQRRGAAGSVRGVLGIPISTSNCRLLFSPLLHPAPTESLGIGPYGRKPRKRLAYLVGAGTVRDLQRATPPTRAVSCGSEVKLTPDDLGEHKAPQSCKSRRGRHPARSDERWMRIIIPQPRQNKRCFSAC